MKLHITKQQWMSLDNDTRRQFIDKFLIKKSGPTEVEQRATGSIFISDGVTEKDLEKSFNILHMIEGLGDLLPWYRKDLTDVLFNLVLDKFYGRSVEWIDREGGGVESPTGAEEGIKAGRKGRGRKAESEVQEVS